jgi:hypothetical protein
VQIQLDRQKYLQERAAKEESELRAMDEKIPSGASRPMLSPIEEDQCVVSAHALSCLAALFRCIAVCG